jgi:hypothetical protein
LNLNIRLISAMPGKNQIALNVTRLCIEIIL